jgi:N-acetylneuraminate synthase
MKRSEVAIHQGRIRSMLEKAGIPVTDPRAIEVADFGLGRFEREGLGLILRVNEPEYCSKWLTLYPGQSCPWHYHKLKKETFFIHQGEGTLNVDRETIRMKPGDRYTIAPPREHEFSSSTGAVIEEVSTHDENFDSYFRDPNILRDPKVEED